MNIYPSKASLIRIEALWLGLLGATLCHLPIESWANEDRHDQRPNIVWITAEDMSPTLGCYGDEFATTPYLDAFARQSTRYTHAFATAPVCSPSRACLINGCIATTQGTHAMRSLFPLPAEMKGFPSLLRASGYYTSNNVKTDYNSASESLIIRSSWDECSEEADWHGRRAGQPFFSVFNLMASHQSRTMVWPYEKFVSEIQSQLEPGEIHEPDNVPVPPYYPDTPAVRKTMARFYDCVTVMDKQVGALLKRLDDEGLAENTIVFFYSDHGSGMPRHKRALLDSGMHVPFMIRVPEMLKSLRATDPGEVSDQLVCFEDFAPTVLRLAGVTEVPGFMRGRAFLQTTDIEQRQFVYGHRDRVDEMLDMARSVRSAEYLYIRNFMPHLGYNQQSAWIDDAEIRKDFYSLAESGKATAAQLHYVGPSRPREELYDCSSDPLNLRNLARSEQYQGILVKMREALREHMIDSRDLGLVPEIELWKLSEGTTPMAWATTTEFDPEAILKAAELVGSEDDESIHSALEDQQAAIRYWGAVSCSAVQTLPDALINRLIRLLGDSSIAVRIEAAAALANHGEKNKAYATLIALLDHTDQTVVLHAARALELIGDPALVPVMQRLAERYAEEPGDLAWFIRFSTTGYLNRLP